MKTGSGRPAFLALLLLAAAPPPSEARAPTVARVAGPAKPTSPALSAETATQRVQRRYDATETFSADFDQEMKIESGGQVLRSSGKVWFQRPGRMLWRYEKPDEQTIVCDGEYLWIHQPADKQVLRAPLRDAFESRTPVSFLLGVASVERDFRPALLAPAGDGSVRLRLDPLADPQAVLGSLELELDPVTFDIRAAIIRDSIGNTTRVALRGLVRNRPLDPALFRFEPPAGTDVQESPAR